MFNATTYVKYSLDKWKMEKKSSLKPGLHGQLNMSDHSKIVWWHDFDRNFSV